MMSFLAVSYSLLGTVLGRCTGTQKSDYDSHVVEVRLGLFQWVGRWGGRILVHQLISQSSPYRLA
jgi:hypothetical protein